MLNANSLFFLSFCSDEGGRSESLALPTRLLLPSQEPSGASNISAASSSVEVKEEEEEAASLPETREDQDDDDIAKSVGSVKQEAIYSSSVLTLAAGPEGLVHSLPSSHGNNRQLPTNRKPPEEPARNTDPPSVTPEANDIAVTSSGTIILQHSLWSL